MARQKKRRGHWCWACNRVIANERFSGGGHARHICRECQKLPAEELAYRQSLRDLGRCMTDEGVIPRKRRKQFNQFLEHSDPRIRKIAQEMQAEEDQASRQLERVVAGDCDDERDDDVAEHEMFFDDEFARHAEHDASEPEYEADGRITEGVVSDAETASRNVGFAAAEVLSDSECDNAEGKRLLAKILEDALEPRASEVELERVSNGLEVTFMFGNAGIGGVLVDREHDDDVIGFIWSAAKPDRRDRGEFQMILHGRRYKIRVERYDLFGESAFRLKLAKAMKDAP